MIEKSLHSANIAAAIAVVATATDLTLTGGAATGIGAALSGVVVFKDMGGADKKQAKAVAAALEGYIANSHLTAGRRLVVRQVFAKFPPSLADIAAGNHDAASIAANLRDHVQTTATDPSHKTPQALQDYNELLTALLKPALRPRTQQEADITKLLKRTETSEAYTRMLEAGVTEHAILKLAQRVAEDVDDLGQAWIELQNAIEMAIRVQKEGKTPSNHGDFVDTVLARVAELAKDGAYGDAGAAIEAALAEEDASHERRKDRLLRSGIELALLDRDTDKAADLLIIRADLAVDGRAKFDDLRVLQDLYYEQGRDKGFTLDLMVAIALAKRILALATNMDERGTAQNDLGNALATLGQRHRDSERLEQAVMAFRAALEERTQDNVPLGWAMTQNNLGAALLMLAERGNETARLEMAIKAFRAALEERTQDKVPLDWAMTQNNLGNALKSLGARDSDTARLEQAILAFRAALEEWTQDKVPLDWAGIQNNLGTVLSTLGARESDSTRLEQAVAAYRAALEERTQDKVPLEWAATQYNLANLELAFHGVNGEAEHLQQARGYALAAQQVFADSAPHYAAMCDRILALIDGLGGD
ncbi:MAG: tetratricopeptide repeat protein [Alphaproteobacteria bacterium]|nr:tetratricopeptide repeat protein [Alphaproteobacteria bacterium]